MKRRPRLGIAPVRGPEVYSVCKLLDADPESREYLSVAAMVYSHASHRAAMVEVAIVGLEVKKVAEAFCGIGPSDFQELVDVSQNFLEESRTPRRLICQEGFKTIEDATYFITSHLWLEPRLERYEAMGALEEASEAVYVCFGIRP
jgi:hypothetical protein